MLKETDGHSPSKKPKNHFLEEFNNKKSFILNNN